MRNTSFGLLSLASFTTSVHQATKNDDAAKRFFWPLSKVVKGQWIIFATTTEYLLPYHMCHLGFEVLFCLPQEKLQIFLLQGHFLSPTEKFSDIEEEEKLSHRSSSTSPSSKLLSLAAWRACLANLGTDTDSTTDVHHLRVVPKWKKLLLKSWKTHCCPFCHV